MKLIKKIVSFVLAGAVLLCCGFDARAAEVTSSMDFVPAEFAEGSMEKTEFGDYSISIENKCQVVYADATTLTWNSITEYGVYSTEEVWYKITQKTNYTYDGSTVHINTENCKLNVTCYKDECDYTVNINTVNNTSTTAPTYTIGVSMKMHNWLTIVDVATVYADGTTNLQHSEY